MCKNFSFFLFFFVGCKSYEVTDILRVSIGAVPDAAGAVIGLALARFDILLNDKQLSSMFHEIGINSLRAGNYIKNKASDQEIHVLTVALIIALILQIKIALIVTKFSFDLLTYPYRWIFCKRKKE